MSPDGPFWIDRTGAPSREKVRFVLVRTTEPGNAGASARAIKAMGFRRLVLVDPACDWNTPHAVAMAHGAEEVLENAVVAPALDEAIADCAWVVGTTRRSRRHQAKSMTPRAWGERLASTAPDDEVAILFGPEKTGLHNEEVLRCRRIVTIPSPVDHPSLNLAQSVMVMAYECALALREPAAHVNSPAPATDEEYERMYGHLEGALRAGRMQEKKVRSTLRHLRIILGRAGLSGDETQPFHAIAAKLEWLARKIGGSSERPPG